MDHLEATCFFTYVACYFYSSLNKNLVFYYYYLFYSETVLVLSYKCLQSTFQGPGSCVQHCFTFFGFTSWGISDYLCRELLQFFASYHHYLLYCPDLIE